MKKTIIIILGLLVAITTTYAQDNVDVKLKVDGIIKGKGILRISVFDNEDQWLKKSVKTLEIDLSKEDTDVFVIPALAKGNYAISVIQDENKNGELDMGMMGPEEGYGFSNGAKGTFGPPSYSKAMISITGNMETSVQLD